MKPFFALSLDDDRIGLLHRTPSGWSVVGTTRFDAPEFASELAALRDAALGLQPDALSTTLILPESQIFYSTAFAPGPGTAVRRAQIAAALEGQTPYDLADLIFDWSGEGDHVEVAVVARETLGEAEAFAVEHGFNPLGFSARPESPAFDKAPWFGETAFAANFLTEGETVDPEGPLLPILAKAPAPVVAEPTLEPLETLDDQAPEPQVEETPAELAEAGLSATDAAVEPAPVFAPADESLANEPSTGPAVVAATDDLPVADTPSETPEAAAQPAIDMVAEALAAPPVEAPVESPVEPPVQADAQPVVPEPVAEPVAKPVIAAPAEAAPAVIASPPVPELPTGKGPARPKAVAAALAASLVNQRSTSDAEEELEEPEQTQSWPGEEEAIALDATKAALAASLAPTTMGDSKVNAAPRAEAPPKRVEPLPAMPAAPPRVSTGAPQLAKVEGPTAERKPVAAKPGKGAKVKIRPSIKSASPSLPASAQQPNLPQPATEQDAMTVFGQRNAVRVGGKPRYLGLALTGGLLLVLLLIAIWAASFLEPQSQSSAIQEETQLAAAPSSQEEIDEDESAVADLPEGEGATDTAPETQVAAPAPEAPATDVAAVSTQNAEPVVAATGAAPADTRAANDGAVETLTLPTTDGAVAAPPAARLALAGSGSGDPLPRTPATLPAYGSLFQFDDAGNIIPTAEGVVTPEGFTLMARKPSRLPPPRPEGLVPVAAPEAAATVPATSVTAPGSITPLSTEPNLSATVSTSSGFEPDQTFVGHRPRQRPQDVAPAVAPPAADEGALSPESSTPSQASIRPALRPASLVAAAQEQAEAAAASTASLASLTTEVAPTRRPPARPARLTERANAATAAAAAAAAAAASQQTASLAATARNPAPNARASREEAVEDDDGEPEVTRAAPAIPTRASVAKQATVTRGIRLSSMNLIGVFGKSNARYALVREGGGRMSQVRVGDRLDGGQVVAIGQSELSYRKRGGQTVRLQMPRG